MQIVLNSFIPTDLKELVEVKIEPALVPLGGRSDVAFFGKFDTENKEAGESLVELGLSTLLSKKLKTLHLDDEVEKITEFVLGIFVGKAMGI